MSQAPAPRAPEGPSDPATHPLACPQCRRVEAHAPGCSRRVRTPALDRAVRSAVHDARPMKPVEPAPRTPERESDPGAAYVASVARERALRVVKLLRILDASPGGESVDELCRALGTDPRMLARDLDLLVDADEPLLASGPLAARETHVALARESDG